MIRKPRRSLLTIVVALLAVAVVLPTGVGFAAYQHDHSRRDQLPANTVVGGVDVSGLHRTEAIAKVRATVDAQLRRQATLVVGDHEYTISAHELGVRDNVEAAVDTAFEAGKRGSWVSRTWDRVFGDAERTEVEVGLTDPAMKPLRALVRQAARENYVAPVNATAKLNSSSLLDFVSAKPGLEVRKKEALAALRASLEDGEPREVELHEVEPQVTDETYDTAILVQANANKLYLYKNGKIAKTYSVATGAAGYETPVGHWSVTLKRYMPTWVNPSPTSGWGASMPPTIAPGPSNPLGLRALNLSAPLIRIHGSPADYSIGYNASHGCIRMHNSDVVDLYDRVPTGTPVIITRVGPLRPLGSSTATSTTPDDGDDNDRKKSSTEEPRAEGG